MSEIQQKSKKRAMLVLVGCCLMQMVGLGTVLNASSAYFAFVPVLAGVDMVSYVMWISMYGIAALAGTFLGGILLPKNAKLFLSIDVIVVALCLVGFTFAYYRMRRMERDLDIHIFCSGNLVDKGFGKKPSNKVYDKPLPSRRRRRRFRRKDRASFWHR